VHELATLADDLLSRYRRVLEGSEHPGAAALRARAQVKARPKPRMVLTGEFSSGKSKLITALTDRAVEPPSDADIATDEVTPYDWDGAVTLVDTPGVKSGIHTHDDLAQSAVGDADFILFVVPVGHFEDATRDYLRHLANELQLFGQMIVVLTQAGKQGERCEGIREKEVLEALGTDTINLPVAQVDSVFYLRSLEGGPRAELLRERSGIDGLRSMINSISKDRGELAQLRQPLHLVRQLCDEAQVLFVGDGQSRTALALLSAQRSAVSERRYMIEKSLLTAETEFKSACLGDVRAFVDTATSLPADDAEAKRVLAEAEPRLVDALERHAERFSREINALSEMQFDKLSSQLLEIGESNRAQMIGRPDARISVGGPGEVGGIRSGRLGPGRNLPNVDWKRVADQLKNGQQWWGAGDGIKNAAGGNGHRIVLDIGHKFGKKFKPWEAVKIADKIGKAAKIGGFAIQVGAAGYEVFKDERDARRAQIEGERQHAAFVTEIMGHADKIAADAREQLWAIIDPPMNEFLATIDESQREILEADRDRVDAANELVAIAAEADRALADPYGLAG
jgi:hypothetical protein